MMHNFTVKSLLISETFDEGIHRALDLNLDWNELQATASETPSVPRGEGKGDAIVDVHVTSVCHGTVIARAQ